MNRLPRWMQRMYKPFDEGAVRCTRCLYDETTYGISFDNKGVCNYCRMLERFEHEYPTGDEGRRILEQMAAQIKKDGRGKKYDVVVGVSGGCDSSYLLQITKELGLRPLAAHYDNGWNSNVAKRNLSLVVRNLKVDLETHHGDHDEYDRLHRSFLMAGVPEVDAPSDIGFTTAMYMMAAEHKVKYIFNGHSFRTEGVSPLGWCYTDGKYIESVHRKYGDGRFNTYPNLWMSKFLKYVFVNKIKRIRPLYWVDYNKENVKEMLSREYSWNWYGGHHLENKMTHFNHSYVFALRFGMDQRLNGYSALIRSGQMTRKAGIELMKQPPRYDSDLIEEIKERLKFTDVEFKTVMTQPKQTFRNFKTYKETFEAMRPLFWLAYKMDLVPKSFYMKYTK